MANVKISGLPTASTPLTGAELVPVVQSGVTSQTTVDNLLNPLAETNGSSLVAYLPSGTGAVATTVQAKLRETVSVKDFGAVGDGVTDDTAAIQAAIDYCRTLPSVLFGNSTTSPYTDTASTLLFPAGKYRVTNSLWFGINTSVTYNTSQIVQNVLGYGAIIIGQTTGKPVFDMSGAFGMKVSGITIETDVGAVNSPPANAPNVGILLARTGTAVTNPSAGGHHFTDVYVHGHYSIACVYNYASEINYWTDCYFVNQSGLTAYWITSKNETSSNTSRVTSVWATIDHTLQSCYADFITNCLFKQSTGSTVSGGSVISAESASYGPKITNCYIDGSGAVAMPNVYLFNAHGLTSADTAAANLGVSILNSTFEYHGLSQYIVQVGNDHIVQGLSMMGCSMNGTGTQIYLSDATAKIFNYNGQKTCGDVNNRPLVLGGSGEYVQEVLQFSSIRTSYGNTWNIVSGWTTNAWTAIDVSAYGVPKTAKYLQIRVLGRTNTPAADNAAMFRGYNMGVGYEGQWHYNNPQVNNIQTYTEGLVPVVLNGTAPTIEYYVPSNFSQTRLRIVGYWV